MPKIKVSLSIGFVNCRHEEEIDIDDDEWNDCETDEQREELMDEYWKEWSANFIDGVCELIDT